MSEQSDTGLSQEQFSFPEAEHRVLKFWQERDIFKKSLEKTKNSPPYIFYDGPPFATGLPHHGHLVGGTLKDIVPRFFTMKGRYVERRFGWDCHGLPIEQEIDKKFGMSAQDAVKQFGVAKYNSECRGIVQRYTAEWEKTVNRMGRWVDFKNDYKTMDLNFMESVWWVFKRLWDMDLVYKGTKVMPYSTALGTVLSNFEATSNYQDVQDPAITILFKLKNEDTYLAAWTTTPWTLPSNLGLCVGPEIEYQKVHVPEKNLTLILAKALVEKYKKSLKLKEVQVLETFLGSSLKGKRYEPLFPYFKKLESDGAFVVLNDNYVTTDSGTGVVHTAPSFGEDDSRVMKEAGLNLEACPLDDAGRFNAEVPDYAGIHVKEADKLIIKRLKDEGKLLEQSTLVHSYPFCPRTDTPLIYRSIPSWYVSVEKIKDKILAANQKIHWVPEHIKEGRFGKWLEGARDWAVSRNRVWGTPLPIWINEKTGKALCLGSIEELHKLSGTKVNDLHREFVDDITFSVPGEEGKYRRITDVMDCWFESGSMPYAQLHYPFENQEMFKKGFPAEFIAEGLDQTRGWFYTLTVLSAALFDQPAFKNVIVNGIVMAEDGKKMSKRLKNYTAPDVLMETYGADALRLTLISSGLVKAEEMRFSDAAVKDTVRRALLPWYNSFKFFQTYASVDGWKPSLHSTQGDNILDQWILSKLQTLIAGMDREMTYYRLYNVVGELLNFIEDLTNWYIRLNRRRFWEEGLSADKKAAYTTLYSALHQVGLLMAPFAPFLSEHIFQELKKFGQIQEESVHLCTYPLVQEDKRSPELEDAVTRMQQVILLGRQKRIQAQIKVKTPLLRLTVIHRDRGLLDEIKKLEDYIKIELNVQRVEYSQAEENFIRLFAKPNAPVLGKRLGKDFAQFRPSIEALSGEDLQKVEQGEKIAIMGKDFDASDLLIYREAKPGTQALSNRFISVDMDTSLNQELINEGLAREVVNRIQKTRKDLGLNVADRISVEYATDSANLNQAIEQFASYIQEETLGKKLSKGPLSGGADVLNFEVEGEALKLRILPLK